MVEEINKKEQYYSEMTDDSLRRVIIGYKATDYSKATKEEKEQVLVNVFAIVREASKRVLGLRHFDVQLLGGIFLSEGFISEMQTGEGCLRFIEVKGRVKGATTVTISKNEMLYALNSPNEFILAIVEVDGQNTRTVYLKEPFKGLEKPSFMEVNRSFNIMDLIRNAQIIYQE